MVQGTKAIRLSKAAREFNVGISTIVEFLQKKGFEIDTNPNTKLPEEAYELLAEEYIGEISVKKESEKLSMRHFLETQEEQDVAEEVQVVTEQPEQEEEVLIKDSTGTPDVVEKPAVTETAEEPKKKVKDDAPAEEDVKEPKEEKEAEEPKPAKEEKDLKVVGKIELEDVAKKPKKKKLRRLKKR